MNKRRDKLFAVLAALLLIVGCLSMMTFVYGGSAEITAYVRHKRTVTVLPTEHGHVTVIAPDPMYDGDTVTFAITPDEGFILAAAYVNGENVTAYIKDNVYNLTVSEDIVFSVTFAPTEHTHKWSEGIVTKEPTDTEEGEMTYTCSICGETKTVILPPKRSPPTGYNSHIYLWLGVAFISLGLLITAARREKNDGEK